MAFEDDDSEDNALKEKWKVISQTRDLEAPEDETIGLISEFIENRELSQLRTGSTIRALGLSNNSIDKKLSRWTKEYYLYNWKIGPAGETRTKVEFELYAPRFVKNLMIVILLLGVMGLSLGLLSLFYPFLLGIRPELVVLSGFLCFIVPAALAYQVFERRSKRFWQWIKDQGMESRIITRQNHSGQLISGFLFPSAAFFFGALGIINLHLMSTESSLPVWEFTFSLLAFTGLVGIVLLGWNLSRVAGAQFDKVSLPAQLGTALQLFLVLPLLSLALMNTTIKKITSSFGTQLESLRSPFLLFNFVFWGLLVWGPLLGLMYYFSHLDIDEIIEPRYKADSQDLDSSPPLNPMSKSLIAYWLVVTLTLLFALPILVFLVYPWNLSGFSGLNQYINVPQALIWTYISTFFLPPLVIFACLGLENLNEWINNNKAFNSGQNLVLNEEEANKYRKLKEAVKNISVDDPDFKRYKDIEVKVVELKDKYEFNAASKGIFRRVGYILISQSFLKEFEMDELKGLLFHELYHLKEDNFYLLVARFLSKITLFGNGLLAAALDFPTRELKADQYASNQVGQSTLVRTLRKVENKRRIASMEEVLRKNLGSLEFFSQFQFEKKELKGFRKIYRLLFTPYLPMYNHPTLQERIDHVKLSSGG